MNKNNIPEKLHYLIPLVLKWGINDDGYRDNQVYNAKTDELERMVESVDSEAIENLNSWLSDEKEIEISSVEYINYTCFFMAYEYAESVIKSRKIKNT